MARKPSKKNRENSILYGTGTYGNDDDLEFQALQKQIQLEDEKEEKARLEEQRQWEAMREREGKPLAPNDPFRATSAWENVQGGSSSTERPMGAPRPLDSLTPVSRAEDPEGDLSAIGLAIRSSRENVALDKKGEGLVELAELDTPAKREALRTKLLASSPNNFSEASIQNHRREVEEGLAKIAAAERLAETPGGFEARVEELRAAKAAVNTNAQTADQYFKNTDSWFARTTADTLGQYEQVGSIAGGVVGGMIGNAPGATVGAALGAVPQGRVAYRGALVDAVLQGVPLETARKNAAFVAGSEFAVEAIGGKLASRFGLDDAAAKVLNRIVATNVGRAAARVGGAGVIGAAEEAATQIFQDTAQQAYRTAVLGEDTDNPFNKYLANQIPRKQDGSLDADAYMENLRRVAAAGALGGTAISALSQPSQVARENRDLLTDAAGRGLDRDYNTRTAEPAAPTTAIDPQPSQDMFGTPEGLPSVEEYNAARQVDNEADAAQRIAQRQVSEQRAREREIAYAEREVVEIKKNSTPYTLQQDFSRIAELQNKITNLKETAPAPAPAAVTEQRTPVQGQMFVPDNSALIADANAQAESATKATEAFQKKQKETANRRRSDARKKHETSVLTQLDPAMPAAQKAQVVGEEMRKWDEANNPDTYLSQVQAEARTEKTKSNSRKKGARPAPVVTPAPQPQAAVVEQEGEANRNPAEVLAQLRAEQAERNKTLRMSGNQNETRESTNPDVISSVFGLIKDKINSSEGATVLRLMASGKVKIVDSLPNGDAGLYDGNTTYISAEHALENGGFAAVVDIAGHEVKHGVDVAGAKATLDSRSNDAIIAGLRAAAKRGDEDAMIAWADATGQDSSDVSKIKLGIPTDKVKRLELAARGINYANAKAQQTGRLESIGRSVLSSIRTNYKNVTGQSYNVNINDLDYLAKRMLKDVALKDVNIQGDVAAATASDTNDLSMTISNGTSAPTQLSAGRTWLSADGKRKYEISDKDSSVQIPENYATGDTLPITDVLRHDKLFEELPDLENVQITFAPLDEGVGAMYQKENKLITVNSNDPGFAGGGKYRWDGRIHRYIIHEMQHAAQNVSGTTGGASPEDFLSPEGKRLRQKKNEYQEAINAAQSLQASPEDYADLEQELSQVDAAYQTEFNKAKSDYMRVLGEYEARRSDQGIPFSEEELDTAGRGRQEATWDKETGVTSATGKKLRPTTTLSMSASSRKTPMAGPTLADNKPFKNWFGESKVVTADGLPKKLFHATPKDFDTFIPGGKEGGWRGPAIWLGPDKANLPAAHNMGNKSDKILELYARIENPLKLTIRDLYSLDPKYGNLPQIVTKESVAALKADGYDGVMFYSGNDYNEESLDEVLVFDPNQVKSATDNNGQFSKAPSYLSMSSSSRKPLPKREKSDSTLGARTWQGTKRLLFPFGGFDTNLLKAGTAGKGASSALSYEAEYLSKTANHAIQNAMKEGKMDRASVMKAVTEAIDSSNTNGGSEVQRARMLKTQLDAKFPNTGIGEAFNNLRSFKWNMAQTLMDLRLKDKKLMTDKEVNIYTKMMNEAEKWTTRAYLNDLDKTYAKRFLKNAEGNPDSEERQKLEAGIDWLVNNSLMIPDDQALEETNLGNLTRMLNNWDSSEGKNLKNIKDTDERREQIIERLAELRDMGGDNARTKAMSIIEDMLMAKGRNTFVGNEVRGMKQNRTVLEARAQLPSELREVLGEVTDPFLREAISLARLTGLVGQTKALTQIYEEGEGKFYKPMAEGNYTHPLEGAAFGPLAGMYVNKETKDFLGSYVATLSQYDTTLQEALETPMAGWQIALQAVQKPLRFVASQAKVAGVVLNAGNMLMNLAGAPLYSIANGVSLKNYWPAFRTAMDIARGNVALIDDPARRAEAEEALRAQAVDSAAVQEMRGGPWKLIESEIDKQTGKGMWAQAWKGKGRFQEAAAEIYAAMDVWTKIATYRQNKDFLTKYNDLEGKGWTAEQIEQEAGYQANRTNISWAAAIPIVKAAEQNVPWLTAFATYKTEVVRSTVSMGSSILKDIELAKQATTPEAKSLATQRAAAKFFGTVTTIIAPVAATLANLINESDEEQERREALAEWDKNRFLIYIGKDADGREHFFNMNRLDPHGVVNDAMVDVWQGIAEGKGLEAIGKATKGLFFGQFSRFVGAQTLINDIAASVYGKPLKDKKDPQTLISGTPVDNALRDYLGLGADVGVNSERVAQDMFVPSQLTVALDKDVLNVVEGNKTAATWLKALGLKGSVQDPDKMIKNAGWEYQRQVGKLKDDSKKLLAKSLSDSDKADALLDIVTKEREAFTKLQKKTAAYEAFDAPQFVKGQKQDVKAKRTFGQAAGLMMSDAGGGLAKKDVANLQSGVFKSSIVTEDMLKRYKESLMGKIETTSPTYKAEVEDVNNRVALLRQAYLDKKENK